MAKKRGRRPWNKGIEVGPKDALTPNQVKRVRQSLARRGDGGLRDLALFSLAIDTMLQGPELLGLTVKDVQRSDRKIRSVIEVVRRREGHQSDAPCRRQQRMPLENGLLRQAKGAPITSFPAGGRVLIIR